MEDMKIIKIMGDEYITENDAFGLFLTKPDSEKVKILMDALVEKCDDEHARYMILKQMDEVSYSDMWVMIKLDSYINILKQSSQNEIEK